MNRLALFQPRQTWAGMVPASPRGPFDHGQHQRFFLVYRGNVADQDRLFEIQQNPSEHDHAGLLPRRRERVPVLQAAANARSMKSRGTRVLGTRWANQLRTFSSSPRPCM